MNIRLSPRETRMLNPQDYGVQTKKDKWKIKLSKLPKYKRLQLLKKPKRKKSPSRQKKTKPVRSKFEATPLGDFLLRYCPTEYSMIRSIAADKHRITADLVDSVVSATQNPMAESLAYRRALGDYRKYRTRTPNAGMIDIQDETELIEKKLGID